MGQIPSDAVQSPTSYHLAYAIIYLTGQAGGTIRIRLNLIDEILGDIEAKAERIQNGERKREIEAICGQLRADLQFLWDNYEPILDYNPYTSGKSAAFEGGIAAIRTRMMKMIEKYGLVSREDFSVSMPSPAQARMAAGGKG